MAVVKLFQLPDWLGGNKRDINYEKWMDGVWTVPTGYTGRALTNETAMQNATVFACTRVIAEAIGSLPLVVFQDLTPRGRARAREHSMFSVLHDEPNPEMTAVEYKEAIAGHLVRWGNAYSQIVSRGPRVELWPLRPDRMRLARRKDNNELIYMYTMPGGEERALGKSEVWHLRGLSGDGVTGYSVLGAAKHAIELTLAAEEFGSRLFGNQAKPGGLLTTDKSLSDKAIKRMREDWESLHKGLTQSHRVAILEEGVKWQQVTLPPEDAQFLETRKFQRNEIATFFRVPPHMVGDLERATFSNIEHQSLEFVTYTLLPWLTRIEQSAKKYFLADPYYCKFVVQALLRGDQKTRYEAYGVGIDRGFLCPDDIRELEEMNPIGETNGGNTYRVPINMLDMSLFKDYSQAQVDKAKAPPPAPNPPSTNQDDREAAPDSEEDSGQGKEQNRAILQPGSVRSRVRIAETHRRSIEDAVTRVVRREVRDVKKIAESTLRRRDAVDFEEALREHYATFDTKVADLVRASMTTLAEAAAYDAAAEVGSEVSVRAVEDFAEGYVKTFSGAHCRKSFNQLREVMGIAVINGLDPLTMVQDRLNEWGEKRAKKVSEKEAHMLTNAITKDVWKGAGVGSLRWVAYNRACPYCRALDGRKVGIDQNFLEAGDQFNPPGAPRPLNPRSGVGHPPGHGGCHCGISPA